MTRSAREARPGNRNYPGIMARIAFGLTCLCLLLLRAGAQAQPPAGAQAQPPVGAQAPPPAVGPGKATLPTLFPGRERAFRLESEAELYERMIRDAYSGQNPLNMKYKEIFFPEYPPVPKGPLPVRQWTSLTELVPPPFVCYHRLYFEQLNLERYGWDLGVLSPLAAVGAFYVDLFALPYHAATEPLRRYECNTGYCLPGDPVPLLLYPPEISLTGALGEAAAIGLAVVIFP